MDDLIYRKTAKEMFLHAPMTEDEKILVFRRLNAVPAVDAVEVVRCRECRFNPKHEWTGCPMAGTWRVFDYDGFCSYGKHREDGKVVEIDQFKDGDGDGG